MVKYYFETSMDMRIGIEIEADSGKDAIAKACAMFHDHEPDMTLANFKEWWVKWAGLYDESGVLVDEMLYE